MSRGPMSGTEDLPVRKPARIKKGDRFEWHHGPPMRVHVVRVVGKDNVLIENEHGEQYLAHPVELRATPAPRPAPEKP